MRVINPLAVDMMVPKDLCIGTAEPVVFNCTKCGPVCFCEPIETDEQVSLQMPELQVRTVATEGREGKNDATQLMSE